MVIWPTPSKGVFSAMYPGAPPGLAALRLALEVEADPELLFKVARKADEDALSQSR